MPLSPLLSSVRVLTAVAVLAALPVLAKPTVDEAEVRALLEKGRFTPPQSQALLAFLDRADRQGLPVTMLVNRVREGVARRAEPKAVLGVVEDRLRQLERAEEVVQKCRQHGVAVRDRERALLTLADAFALGVAPGDVLALVPPAAEAKKDVEAVARAAETLGRLARKGFPPKDTRDVVAVAMAVWPVERMEDLVGLFLQADALRLAPDETRDLLIQEVRDKKGDPGAASVSPGRGRGPSRDRKGDAAREDNRRDRP